MKTENEQRCRKLWCQIIQRIWEQHLGKKECSPAANTANTSVKVWVATTNTPMGFYNKRSLRSSMLKKKTKHTHTYKKPLCSLNPVSLDSNHIGPPTFCFPLYLHIWLPLGIKIGHWKIFGLKLFIINLEEGLKVCVCVFEGWFVIKFSFVIRGQNFWVWWL